MDERRKQIIATLAKMDKQFGKGSVLLLGSRAALPADVISTGSVAVDNALGTAACRAAEWLRCSAPNL